MSPDAGGSRRRRSLRSGSRRSTPRRRDSARPLVLDIPILLNTTPSNISGLRNLCGPSDFRHRSFAHDEQLSMRLRSGKDSAFDDPRLRAVRELVIRRLAHCKGVSLKEAAKAANYSPQHFSEYFRKRVGVSFRTWQCGLRMEHAKKLLVRKDWMQVSAIARAVGYEPSSFCRSFKRHQGINPQQLRALVREYPLLKSDVALLERPDLTYTVTKLARNCPEHIRVLTRLAKSLAAIQGT